MKYKIGFRLDWFEMIFILVMILKQNLKTILILSI